MALEAVSAGSAGFGFLLGGGIVYEIVAANVSSPQTTQLNPIRAETLMQWVHLGLAQSVLFVGAAALIDRRYARPIIAGGVLAMVLMEGLYLYAKRSGQSKSGPPTEKHDTSPRGLAW